MGKEKLAYYGGNKTIGRSFPWPVYGEKEIQALKKVVEKTYNYVMENYPLKKHGFPLWNFSGDRKMTFVEEYERIENYHHPRHLMLNILSLERILKNGNRPLFPGNKDSIDT